MPSAMKGVVFTATGEPLATPTPAELASLFVNSPKVGLNFATIFDFAREGNETEDDEDVSPPPSPLMRERPRSENTSVNPVAPTRLRRPSIRRSVQRPTGGKKMSLPSSVSDPAGLSASMSASSSQLTPIPTRPPMAKASTLPHPLPAPEYDFSDDENLPSPFLKRVDRERVAAAAGATLRGAQGKRPSGGNLLRAVAAANAANGGRRGTSVSSSATKGLGGTSSSDASPASAAAGSGTRPSLASARKASEEARKALMRP